MLQGDPTSDGHDQLLEDFLSKTKTASDTSHPSVDVALSDGVHRLWDLAGQGNVSKNVRHALSRFHYRWTCSVSVIAVPLENPRTGRRSFATSISSVGSWIWQGKAANYSRVCLILLDPLPTNNIRIFESPGTDDRYSRCNVAHRQLDLDKARRQTHGRACFTL